MFTMLSALIGTWIYYLTYLLQRSYKENLSPFSKSSNLGDVWYDAQEHKI